MIQNWILDYVKKHGKELALRAAREILIPWLKQQAILTKTKLDDYAAKQSERIVNDPEFIAALEEIG